MQSAQDCMCNDVPEAVDRALVRRILSERNMRTPSIVIGGAFRKDPPQVLCVPKTLSALISRRNHLTSVDHIRTVLFRTGRLGLAMQVDEPMRQRMRFSD